MPFKLRFTRQAQEDLKKLENDSGLHKRLKAVRKSLGLLESNPRHPGLNTHAYDSLAGENGEKVFEAYAENNTPAAYHVFWHYGPNEMEGKGKGAKKVSVITILAITSHP